jgi:acyl-CoA thioesterase-1
MNMVSRNVILALAVLSCPPLATAEEIKIVALGASQTEGKGVSESDAYPAQLEQLLKAEGYSISVINEGISGNTTRDLLDRFSRAVPEGTKLVILQPGTNDRVRTNKRNALSPDETRKNVEQMLTTLKERNIAVILLGYPGKIGRDIAQQYSANWYPPSRGIAPDMIQADGIHFTKEGNAVLAKNMSVIVKKIIDKTQK